ncbi:hypothetical protein TRFO_31703 [Tritrichomonas foetus]|uniref:Ras-GAP domain-containing protein n=1 Tax=Tritrichomonas foetus TaxID=1144522 RepID=A0A1J4JR13_9EUKA|nr:hypothetical protein TRFO_31703 [Tritrichomonas foetus]|eukprot:OHT01475.1 hypothetical protein TRFO_31703 [Tritrichomonas foetus]
MMSLPFALKGSYILYGIDGNEEIEKPEPVAPPSLERSQVCDYIAANSPEEFSLIDLLNQIEQDHVDHKNNYYLDIFSIALIPKADLKSPKERIQFLKNILNNLFTREQIDTCGAGRANVALNSLTEWQRFILSASLQHFERILKIDGVYQSDIDRKNYVRNVLQLFVPPFLRPPEIVRVVSPVTLIDGTMDISKPSKVYITVTSPKNITLESQDLLICSKLNFNSSDYVGDDKIQLTSADITTNKFVLGYKSLSKETWNNILWPVVGVQRSASQSVVDSCLAYGKAKKLSPAAVSCMARVVATTDYRFLFALYNVLDTEINSLNTVFNSVLNFYAFHSKHLQLMKFLCFYELQRTENTNEIFRQNNNFIRSINLFMRRVSDKYLNTTIKDLYFLIAKMPQWKLENPDEKDCEILTSCLQQFWQRMIETVDTIPPSIRNICRYLRIASELLFREKNLNHRAIYGVFLLRFTFVVLVSPMEFGVNMEDDPVGYAKVTQFTKVLAFSGQFMKLGKNEESPKAVLNPAIEETNELVLEFYEKLCLPVEADDVPVSQEDLSLTTIDFCKFVQNFKEPILSYDQENSYSYIFVDEIISEFLTNY